MILGIIIGFSLGIGMAIVVLALGRAARLGDDQIRVRSVIVVDAPNGWPQGRGVIEIEGEPVEVVTVPRETPE